MTLRAVSQADEKTQAGLTDVPTGDIYVENYRLVSSLGEGGFGCVHVVADIRDNRLFALKRAKQKESSGDDLSPANTLKTEIDIMKELRGDPSNYRFFPMLIWSDASNTSLVMELLGPSLGDFSLLMLQNSNASRMGRQAPSQGFSYVSLVRLSIHMLRCIQRIHEMGYVHRDVKPGNFLLTGDNKNPVCLVDFGLTIKATEYVQDHTFVGTPDFACLNAHDNLRQHKSDDVQSWLYSVLDLAGYADWAADKKKEKRGPSDWASSKKALKNKELGKGEQRSVTALAEKLLDVFQTKKLWEDNDKPDYNVLFEVLDSALEQELWFGTPVYEWETMDNGLLSTITWVPLTNGKSRDRAAKNLEKSEKTQESCTVC